MDQMQLEVERLTSEVCRLQREVTKLQLKVKDADRLAACVDVMVRRNVLDPRSIIGDARLGYGDPFDMSTAEKLMLQTRPGFERELA